MPLNGHVSLVYGISVDSQSIRKSTYSTGEEGVEKEILSQFLLPSVTLCYHIRRCLKQYIGLWLSLVERCVRDAEAAGSNPVNPTSNLEQVIGETGGLLFYAQRRERIPSEALTLPMGCVATCGHRVTNAEKAG